MKASILILAGILLQIHALPASAFETVKRPILYPNAHYSAMGRDAALTDIENCWEMARQTGASETGEGQLSEQAASDAAAVAAAGVLGRDPHRAAVAGAAAGGAASIAAGGISRSDPPPVFRGIVERCLFEKGYEVAGWE